MTKSAILVNSTDTRRAEWVAMLGAVGIEATVVAGAVEVDCEIARRWLTASDVIVQKKLKGEKADKLRIKILLDGHEQTADEILRSAAREQTKFLSAERANGRY
jgi:hypothetical protein